MFFAEGAAAAAQTIPKPARPPLRPRRPRNRHEQTTAMPKTVATAAMAQDQEDLPSGFRAAARKAIAKARAAPAAIWAHCKKQTLQLGKVRPASDKPVHPAPNKLARPAKRAV
ncbi:hypothetical protein XPA_010222 [Xanthoria parietina]